MIGMGKPITRTPKMAQKHPRTLPKPVIGDTSPYPTCNINSSEIERNYPVQFLLMKISFQIVDKSVESVEKFVSNLDNKSVNINIMFRQDSINSLLED